MIFAWFKINILLLIWGAAALTAHRLCQDAHGYMKMQKRLILVLAIAAIIAAALPSFFIPNPHFESIKASILPIKAEMLQPGFSKTPHLISEQTPTAESLDFLAGTTVVENSSSLPYWVFLICLCIWIVHLAKQLSNLRKIISSSKMIRSIHGIEMRVTDHKHTPFAFWRPGKLRVIVPIHVVECGESLAWALRHEFSHHKLGHTYLTYPLEFLNAFFLMNPGYRIFYQYCHDLMEYQCDSVLKSQHSPSEYGAGLLHIARLGSSRHPSWGLAMTDMNSQLKRRIHLLLKPKIKTSIHTQINQLLMPTIILISSTLLGAFHPPSNRTMSLKEAKLHITKLKEENGGHFPLDMNESILKHLNKYIYSEDGIEFVLSSKANLAGQESILIAALANANIPPELIAIPFVEAGFASIHPPRGTNRSAGLWQFIPETARRMGLKVDSNIDERYDALKSTFAAVGYLKALYEVPDFQKDWRLVVLAYNAGERAVLQKIREHKTQDPWKLNNIGDSEYLAKVMAAAIILKSPNLMAVTQPLQEIQISSPFGPRAPSLPGDKNHFHSGIDLAAHVGDPIFTPKKGVVTEIYENSKLGKTIVIRHSNKITTQYSKLSKVSVRKGTRVSEGDIIGLVGNSGESTGSHLHFEFRINAKAVDPRIFLFRYQIL